MIDKNMIKKEYLHLINQNKFSKIKENLLTLQNKNIEKAVKKAKT